MNYLENRWIISFIVCLALASVVSSSWAGKVVGCYVSGDTSGNKTGKPLGSAKNPYDSLAAVAANAQCNEIIVVYSGVTLDGGITLRPGQKLIGEKGPLGSLPVITNGSGHGIQLATDNTIKHLHVQNAWHSGIAGQDVGTLKLQDVTITGAGQSNELTSWIGFDVAYPSVLLSSASDSNVEITHSEFGESNGSSIAYAQFFGHGEIELYRVIIRDQGDLAGAFASPGLAVFSVVNSIVDVSVTDSSVTNIGAGGSNSDGLLLLNMGNGGMNVDINGYSYLNPDGDGGGSATGIEMGNLFGPGGGFFNATVINSTIEGSTSVGIHVVDQQNGGGDTLEVTLENNNLIGNRSGICVCIVDTPDSDVRVTIRDNFVIDSVEFGIYGFYQFGPLAQFAVLMEENTISNNGLAGVYFYKFSATADVENIDAGLGGLDSIGHNRILNSGLFDIISEGVHISAANNWWGSATGPSFVGEFDGGTVNVIPFLTADPD